MKLCCSSVILTSAWLQQCAILKALPQQSFSNTDFHSASVEFSSGSSHEWNSARQLVPTLPVVMVRPLLITIERAIRQVVLWIYRHKHEVQPRGWAACILHKRRGFYVFYITTTPYQSMPRGLRDHVIKIIYHGRDCMTWLHPCYITSPLQRDIHVYCIYSI